MPLMACLPCRTFFKIKKNGVPIVEGMPIGREGAWTDYKLWMGDLYGCESCGAEVIAGFGQQPIAEHYQPDYAVTRARYAPVARIEDCPGMFHAKA